MTNSALNTGDPGNDEPTNVDSSIHRRKFLEQMEAEKESQNSDIYDDTTIEAGKDYPGHLKDIDQVDPTMISTYSKGPAPKTKPASKILVGEAANEVKGIIEPEESDISEITFLHPKEVIAVGESSPGDPDYPYPHWAVAIDEEGKEELLAPEDIIQIVETKTSKAIIPPSPEQAPESEEPAISIKLELDESDLIETEKTTLSEFIEKDTLTHQDAYVLFDLIIEHFEDDRLHTFIERIAPTIEDAKVFYKNIERLSPAFIQMVLVIGHDHKDPDCPYLMYIGDLNENQGSVGAITKALITTPDRLELEEALIKSYLVDNDRSKEMFAEEKEVARKVRHRVENYPDDPRNKHVLKPLYIGSDYILMPLIQNHEGHTETMFEIEKKPEKDKEWLECLIGAVKGSEVLSEMGVLNLDMKPSNICSGTQGGVLIDWGGFFDPEKNTKMQSTPSYTSIVLAGQELIGKVSRGTNHKFIFQRIIEKRLYQMKSYPRAGQKGEVDTFPERKQAWSAFSSLGETEKLLQPPIQLDEAYMSPGDRLLYRLYLQIQKAHRHPYPFIENNPEKGIDDEYISTAEIIAKLEEISKYY